MTSSPIPPAVARLCEDELHRRLPRMRAAVAQRNRASLVDDAHALRGMAGNFGLAELAQALAALEAAARHTEEGVEEAMAEVERALVTALETLARWR
ncbi:MAG: Hpt domain-containing protein [Rhodovarius sp.]|nr:Hpt domain-containing protein [Rhodovarius sp.]MDW8315806.1 Hpt domain-containing protein [Rhodovarius sp.]